jgi:hypothetical protein
MSGGGLRTISLMRVIPDFAGDAESSWLAYEANCWLPCRDARVLEEGLPFVLGRDLKSAEIERLCESSRRRLLERPFGIDVGGGIFEASSSLSRLFFRAEPGYECPFIDMDSISPLRLGRLRDDRPGPLCDSIGDVPPA